MKKLVSNLIILVILVYSFDFLGYVVFSSKMEMIFTDIISIWFSLVCFSFFFSMFFGAYYYRFSKSLILPSIILLIILLFIGLISLGIGMQCAMNSFDGKDMLFASPLLEMKSNWTELELRVILKSLFESSSPHPNLTKENFDFILDKVWSETKSVSQLLNLFDEVLQKPVPWYKKYLLSNISPKLVMNILAQMMIFTELNILKYFVDVWICEIFLASYLEGLYQIY